MEYVLTEKVVSSLMFAFASSVGNPARCGIQMRCDFAWMDAILENSRAARHKVMI